LEQICEKDLTSPDVHPEFRLWLTSYPSPMFPISILENGLKITNEAPSGMRAGLERIYKADPVNDMKFFEGCSKEMEYKAMLFSLAFFHCVLVGRKNYGPVGGPPCSLLASCWPDASCNQWVLCRLEHPVPIQ
jgi:dynein heavy chain, axonemal